MGEPLDLAAIRAEAAAATPGPWRSTWGDGEGGLPESHPDFDEETVIEAPALSAMDRKVVGSLWYDGLHTLLRREDAAFIASARTNIPALVDLAETQATKIHALAVELADLRRSLTPVDMANEIDALSHRLREIRKALGLPHREPDPSGDRQPEADAIKAMTAARVLAVEAMRERCAVAAEDHCGDWDGNPALAIRDAIRALPMEPT